MAMDITLILRTLSPVVEAMEQLAIPYHIGGSVASSRYGEFRPTQDVDIVADLKLVHVRSFVKLLEGDYYIVEDAVREAIRLRSWESAIYLNRPQGSRSQTTLKLEIAQRTRCVVLHTRDRWNTSFIPYLIKE